MESKTKGRGAHCVVLAFPSQGHINPMLEFSKRLQQKEITVTFVTTRFFCKNLQKLPASITLDTISDGFDNGWIGSKEAESTKVYFDRFRQVGRNTFSELVEKLNRTGNPPVGCIVYDSLLPWASEVANRFGLVGAIFLTQNLGVNSIYHHVNQGKLQLPLLEQAICLPGLPSLAPWETPSYLYEYGSEPAVFDLVVGQFSNIEKADWILCNTIYELEKEVADCITKICPKLRTIGPTIPYKFLDNNGLEDEEDFYGCAHFKSIECTKWLDDQPKGSVVFVSFGSLAALIEEQMVELAWGLRDSGSHYLWVVRESEEAKLPKDFAKKSEKSLVVSWCHQMKVLSHEAIGCFVTHCGWNSTLEALSLGVPMVAIPQRSDQSTNAKLIMDVWKIGLRAPNNEKGIVNQEALKNSIWEIMKGEKGSEIKNNAIKWRSLAAKAVDKCGSSHNNIEEFVDNLLHLKS